jgi:hypothetical protein
MWNWLRELTGRKPRRPFPHLSQIPRPSPPAQVVAYGDQPLRKAWAEDVLRAEGVPINQHLPMIESEAEITLRSPGEVANRLLALIVVATKGEGLEPEHVEKFVRERNVRDAFSPNELAFIDDPHPSDHDRIQFSWRYEAAWTFLWVLRFVEGQLGPPRDTADVAWLVTTVRDTPDLTIHGLRPANDVLNEADLIYRYHWAVRQAELDGASPPAGLHPGVTMERHHALNWLIGYGEGLDWDDVTTDT